MFSLYYMHSNSSDYKIGGVSAFGQNVFYRAIPEAGSGAVINLASTDARVEVLKEFFTRNNSPLLPYVEKIVQDADQYGLDYRLIPAIAMQESNLCKKIPKDSYNCWGYGIYGGKVLKFADFGEGIDTVSKGISKNYIEKGMTDPNEIMKKYTPGSNGSWANGVNFFMDMLHNNL